MSCLPGMPCYNSPIVKIVYPPGCDPTPLPVFNSEQIKYNGPNLPCTGAQTGECLNITLQKIDDKICSEQLVSQILETIENNDVLKAYFCQLVSSCAPIPSTTTTTSTSTSTTTTTTTVPPIVTEISLNSFTSGVPGLANNIEGTYSINRTIGLIDEILASQVIDSINGNTVFIEADAFTPVVTSWYIEFTLTENILTQDLRINITNFNNDVVDTRLILAGVTGVYTFFENDEYTGDVLNITYEVV
jgi:hypothetical protein